MIAPVIYDSSIKADPHLCAICDYLNEYVSAYEEQVQLLEQRVKVVNRLLEQKRSEKYAHLRLPEHVKARRTR